MQTSDVVTQELAAGKRLTFIITCPPIRIAVSAWNENLDTSCQKSSRRFTYAFRIRRYRTYGNNKKILTKPPLERNDS